jgi:thiol-disulfide isomerase/thioredoxin
MQDTSGATRHSSEWKGKILIVNFWATWCPPCLEEMPELVVFQDQYSSQGVQVVGVAVDNLEQVKSFMELYGINFPVVFGQDDAIELGKKMGNRISALPYTAIFGQNGKTLYAQPGKISIDILESIVKPQLSNGSH